MLMKKLLLVLLCAGLVGAWASRSNAEAGEPLAPGVAAPAFELLDEAGVVHKLSDLKGQIVVLEWTNPDCPFVRRHYKAGTMKKLAEKYKGHGVAWLAINSTRYATSETNAEWRKLQELPYPILDDHAGLVGKLYAAKTTPHMFIVDASGLLAYNGAVDSDPSGDEGQVTNYVDQALSEMLAKRPVSVPQTKSYGCSVKYAS